MGMVTETLTGTPMSTLMGILTNALYSNCSDDLGPHHGVHPLRFIHSSEPPRGPVFHSFCGLDRGSRCGRHAPPLVCRWCALSLGISLPIERPSIHTGPYSRSVVRRVFPHGIIFPF